MRRAMGWPMMTGVTEPTYTEWDQAAREPGMPGVDEMVAAAAGSRAGRSCCGRTSSPRPSWPTRCWRRIAP
jgi:hypothetical protein